MYPFTVGSLERALGGTLLRGSPRQRIQGPDIGFLIRPRVVEDRFVRQLLQRRRSCLIVPAEFQYHANLWRGTGVSIIQVPNTRQALYAVASHVRENLSVPVVQISGSAGKSTTKEMLEEILHRFYPLAGFARQNTVPGVSRNLLRATSRHGAVLMEAGMNGPGQLTRISQVLRPDVIVITSIHREHFLRLGSLENIIAAKAEALEYLSPHGLLVINGDDPNCAKLPLDKFQGRTLRFGLSEHCDVRATDIRQTGFRTSFTARSWAFSLHCRISTFGNYNVTNALAAICVGYCLGTPLPDIARGLQYFRPLLGRLQVERGRDGRLLIDDWYNANPESTTLLLQELERLARQRQLVLVLGDQERPDAPAEYAEKTHYELGKQVAELHPAFLLAVGKWAKQYVLGAVDAGFPIELTAWRPTMRGARSRLQKILRPRQLVVFKASRWINPKGNRVFSNRQLKALV